MLKNFQKIMKKSAVVGIALDQSFFKWRNLLILFLLSLAIVSNITYCYCEAKTFQQYADSVFMGTSVIAFTIVHVYFMLILRQIFGILNHAEGIIHDRE